MFYCTRFGGLRPCCGDLHFFFSQPAAGLTNQVPVQDYLAGTPLRNRKLNCKFADVSHEKKLTSFLVHTSI